MRFSIFDNFGAKNSRPVFQAFESALIRRGHVIVKNDSMADVAVIWSVLWEGRMRRNLEVWNHYRGLGLPVVVLEVGGLFRGRTWRVGINGVNRQGLVSPDMMPADRYLQMNIQMTPWKGNGEHIIIATQRQNSQQWSGMPSTAVWVKSTVEQIRQHTQRPILVRWHPRERLDIDYLGPSVRIQHPVRLADTYDSYDFRENLRDAWAVVNWNSNPGIEAVLAGVPAFVGPDSLAAPVGNLDISQIEKPRMPERQQWINDLCYTEWTLEEIAEGLPLSRMNRALKAQVRAVRGCVDSCPAREAPDHVAWGNHS
jgi:hypothetical protein